MILRLPFLVELEFLNVVFFLVEGKTVRRKTSWSKGKNENKLKPRMALNQGHLCSHHCATIAPQIALMDDCTLCVTRANFTSKPRLRTTFFKFTLCAWVFCVHGDPVCMGILSNSTGLRIQLCKT